MDTPQPDAHPPFSTVTYLVLLLLFYLLGKEAFSRNENDKRPSPKQKPIGLSSDSRSDLIASGIGSQV